MDYIEEFHGGITEETSPKYLGQCQARRFIPPLSSELQDHSIQASE
jgi:hypothetical protein